MKNLISTSLVVAFLALTGPVIAQTASDSAMTEEEGEAAFYFSRVIRNAVDMDGARLQALSLFRRLDLDGAPGLTDRDRELKVQTVIGQTVAQRIAESLRYDLDGDRVVTVDEIRVEARQRAAQPLRNGSTQLLPTEEQAARVVRDFVAQRMTRDLDGDGRITLDEMASIPEEERRNIASRQLSSSGNMPPEALDADGDGIIAEAEYLAAFRTWFGRTDQNRNGILDQTELRASMEAANQATAALRHARQRMDATARQMEFCRFPALNGDEILYVIGGRRGTGLTNLSVTRTGHVLVRMAEIDVPDGPGGIYIIAGFASPTLLRFTGAVDRVRTVARGHAEVLVTGAPDARLSGSATPCRLELSGSPEAARRMIESHFRRTLGQVPRSVIADQIGRVDLKTLRNDPAVRLSDDATPRPSKAKPVADALYRAHPGGFQPFKADEVKSLAEVGTFDPWPMQAGLLQQIEAGNLRFIAGSGSERTMLGGGDGTIRLGNTRIIPGGGRDMILRDGIHYTHEGNGVWVGRKPFRFEVLTEDYRHPSFLVGPDAVEIRGGSRVNSGTAINPKIEIRRNP